MTPNRPTAMSHMGICVRDMNRTIAFYRDLIGMEVMKDEVLDVPALGPRHIYEVAPVPRRVVYLKFGDHPANAVLVLTERASDQPGKPTLLDQWGISHLGFSVPNLAAFTERLLAGGAKPFGPTDSFRSPEGKVLSVFFSDPDGMLLQFDEALNNPPGQKTAG